MSEKYSGDNEYYSEKEDEDEVGKKTKKTDINGGSDDDSIDDNSSVAGSDQSDSEYGDDDDDMDAGSEDGDDARKHQKLFGGEKATKDNNDIDYPMSDDDDDDMDEEEDENYLQKFDETLKQNIISEYHPEMQQLNYNEVELLATIKRGEDGEILDSLHRTLPFLTKFEKARVLGERAKQINDGAKPFVKLTNNAIDGYLIALAELEQKVIPFIIKRPLPNGGCEYWKLKDLEILM